MTSGCCMAALRSALCRRGELNLSRAAALLVFLVCTAVPAYATEAPRVAFFGFSLINTSLEPTKPEEEARIKMIAELFTQKLDASGKFKIVPISAAGQKALGSAAIENCNGCERGAAIASGADWAAWGTVQKVSNLILNINLYMEDAPSGKMEFVKSVDIRGNTDDSWQHGINYILKNYLLNQP
jgi:hypothetical protein